MHESIHYTEIGPNLLKLELARLKAGSQDLIPRIFEMAGRIEDRVNEIPELVAKEIDEIVVIFSEQLAVIESNIGDPVKIQASVDTARDKITGMSDVIREKFATITPIPAEPTDPNGPVVIPGPDGGGEAAPTDPAI